MNPSSPVDNCDTNTNAVLKKYRTCRNAHLADNFDTNTAKYRINKGQIVLLKKTRKSTDPKKCVNCWWDICSEHTYSMSCGAPFRVSKLQMITCRKDNVIKQHIMHKVGVLLPVFVKCVISIVSCVHFDLPKCKTSVCKHIAHKCCSYHQQK